MTAFPATWGDAFTDAIIRQLPPMRRLDKWWRSRPRRYKAVYYALWVLSMIFAARFASRSAPGLVG
jgi:hypothetical protein